MLIWNIASACVALLGAAGSLWLSIGMGLKACPLCFYQRTFLLAAAGILLTGLFTRARGSPLLPGLALPAALGGLGVACFHVYLELNGTLECPRGLFGWGTAPQQSLGAFALLLVLVFASVARGRRSGDFGSGASIAAALIGVLFAAGSILSAPPLPPSPTKPYEAPLEICRPPFRPV